jgi:hypothetical protein
VVVAGFQCGCSEPILHVAFVYASVSHSELISSEAGRCSLSGELDGFLSKLVFLCTWVAVRLELDA